MSQTSDIRQIRIQSRVDTPENWIRENPILLEREIGYETNGKYKIGDGKTQWNRLEYAASGNLNLENGEGKNSLQQKLNTEYFVISDKSVIANLADLITEGEIIGEISEDGKHAAIKAGAFGDNSIAMSGETLASNVYSHTEGKRTITIGYASHAEGDETLASGTCSHVEGDRNIASGYASHAEGFFNEASGGESHAEGFSNKASGDYSHVEGWGNEASGSHSHAEGTDTVASSEGSHAEGNGTIASGAYSHVEGKYNIEDTENRYVHIVGNGYYDESTHSRVLSNAHTLDWEGNAWFAGDIRIGGTKYSEGTTLATVNYVDNANLSKSICYYTNIHPEDWTTYNDGQNTYYQCIITWFSIDEPGSINWNTPLNIDNNSAFIVDFVKELSQSYTKTKERKQQYLDYIANGIVEIQNKQLIITIFGDRPTIDYIPIMVKEI